MDRFLGNIVAIVTPMKKQSYRIDYGRFKELILWHIEQGTNGLVVGGSTGESVTLEEKEWIKLLETAKDTAMHKLSIIGGTGNSCTKFTIKKTLLAEKIGVDAALIVTPCYNKPTQQGLLNHFSNIAANTQLPILLYNVPSRTNCDLQSITVAELSKIPNIIGIKDATGKLERATELKKLCTENFILLSGDDSSFVEFMIQGGMGVISVTGNVCPAIIKKLCTLAATANSNAINTARELNAGIEALHKAMGIESNPIPVKWLLAKLGKIQEACRSPLTNMSKQYHQMVLDAYQAAMDINLRIKEEYILT